MKKGIDQPRKTNPLPKFLVTGWDCCSALERSQPYGLARLLDGARSLLWLPASHYIWGVRMAGCPNRSWCPDPVVLCTPSGSSPCEKTTKLLTIKTQTHTAGRAHGAGSAGACSLRARLRSAS